MYRLSAAHYDAIYAAKDYAAEAAQMETDTSIKMSSAKYKKLNSAVKAKMAANFELKEYP